VTLQKTWAARSSHPRSVLTTVALALLAAWVVILPGHAFETSSREAILMDFQTGAVLFEKDADTPMPPASMSKIMTVYMIFERLHDGRMKLDDTVTVSDNAWQKGGAASGGSTMFLQPGESVTIEDLLHGIIVSSGNDASIVAAEAISGGETAFAELMTRRAREIGMNNSTFTNATGLPDEAHVTTARDMALLAKRTIADFPELYEAFYAEAEFTHNGIRQGNRNPLLNKGADGLKTGHTRAAGYGLTASAARDGRRLILVVNGLESARDRAAEAERILDWGFREFDTYRLLTAGEAISEAEVWLGDRKTVPLTTDRDLLVTMLREARQNMTVTVKYDGPIPAPIKAGDPIAVVVITAPGQEPFRQPLVAAADVGELGLFWRLVATLEGMITEQLN
jgi:serine-type D-Ala-D-Ala carboxypeptidase (penicillin-binding protein 5/6)